MLALGQTEATALHRAGLDVGQLTVSRKYMEELSFYFFLCFHDVFALQPHILILPSFATMPCSVSDCHAKSCTLRCFEILLFGSLGYVLVWCCRVACFCGD